MGDTIGFAFNFWVSDDLRLYWPPTAKVESPATWTNVVISDCSTGNLFYPNNAVDKIFKAKPNPFRDQTNIKYSIPRESRVTVLITDSFGNDVSILVDETKKSGNYSVVWDGKNKSGKVVPAGLYYCSFQVGIEIETIKILKY